MLPAVDFDKEVLTAEDKQEIREWIALLEAEIKCLNPEDHLVIEPQHYFSKGVYAREVFLQAGAIVVGKIHKYQNLTVLSQGEVVVLSIEGLKRVKAPCTFVSPPGVKRVAFAITDAVWTTIHGTDETDLDKIEDTFIAKDYKELLCLG